MADDVTDYGAARITLELDDSGAERQARDVGARIERALTRATRNLGRTVSDNLARGTRDLAVGVRVEPDLSRFERTLRNGLRSLTNLTVPVAPDLRVFRRALTRRGALDSVAIPVTPDTGGFAQALRRALRRVEAEVRVRADARTLVREIEAELRRVRAPRIMLQADVDVSRVQARLRSLDVPQIDARVTLDVDRIESQLRELASRDITIPIHLGEPSGGGDGGDIGAGLLASLRGSLSGAEAIGAGAGAEALGGLSAGLLAAGPWAAVVAGVAAYAALIGKALMTGIEGVIETQQITGALRAALGLGAKDAAGAGHVVGQLYARGVVESVEDGTAAVQAALRNGLAPPDDLPGLESIATQVSDVGHLMEEDIGKVARAVGTMVKTGLVDTASEGLDLLTKSVQDGGNVAEDLLDTFTEYPTQFRQLGISAEEAFGLIQQGLQGGARDSDVIADSLKEFSIEAAQGGKRVTDAFEQAGLDADRLTDAFAKGGPVARDALQEVFDKLQSIKDPLERNQVAVGLFGTKAEDMAGALSHLDLRTAAKEMDDFGGAAARAGDDLRDNLGTKLSTIGRELKQAFVGLFTGDFAQFGDVGRAVEDALPDLKETGHRIAESIKTGIVEYGPRVFSALFDLAFEIGEKVDIWGPLLFKITAGAASIPAAIGALVLTALAGGLAGIGAKLLPYLETAWDAVSDFFTDIIPGWGADLASAVGDALSSAFDTAGSALSTGAGAVVDFFVGLPGQIATGLLGLGALLGQALLDALSFAGGLLAEGGTAVVDFFVGLPGQIVAGLSALPGLLYEAFTSAVAYAIIGLLTAAAGIVYIFTELPTRIWTGLLSLGTVLLSAFTTAVTTAAGWLATGVTTLVTFFATLPSRAYQALLGLGALLVSAFTAGLSVAQATVSGWVTTAVGFFRALPSRAAGALASLGGALLGVLGSAFTSARARVSQWVTDAATVIRRLPGQAASALGALGSRLGGAIRSAAGSALSAASSLIKSIASRFAGLPRAIVDAVGDIGGAIMRKVRGGLPAGVRKFIPFLANGGVVDSPMLGVIGEAGREVVIPLTRPQRARQLAEDSGLLDIIGARPAVPARAPSAAGPAPSSVVNHTWNITETGNAETTAHRVLARLAHSVGA
ncbi:phage tail tape measure protein [Streptomyces sp. CA-253872]|uniref:phage tail tape measure protein n=1 Tax=Streptomyces sp. CA-253872 TaxID=3240067 RepID=UPI003D8B45FF